MHDLPDGDLSLTVRAFGSSNTILLSKQGASLTSLANERRKGYRIVPGDRANGVEPIALIDYGHDCRKWGPP
jgi:hypothetical protein